MCPTDLQGKYRANLFFAFFQKLNAHNGYPFFCSSTSATAGDAQGTLRLRLRRAGQPQTWSVAGVVLDDPERERTDHRAEIHIEV